MAALTKGWEEALGVIWCDGAEMGRWCLSRLILMHAVLRGKWGPLHAMLKGRIARAKMPGKHRQA